MITPRDIDTFADAFASPEAMARYRRYVATALHGYSAEVIDFARRYVATGRREDPPARIVAPAAASVLDHAAVSDFFGGNLVDDPGFTLRLGKVLALFGGIRYLDGARDGDWLLRMLDSREKPRPDGPRWLGLLIDHITLAQRPLLPDAVVLREALKLDQASPGHVIDWLFRPEVLGADRFPLERLGRMGQAIADDWAMLEHRLRGGDACPVARRAVQCLGRSGAWVEQAGRTRLAGMFVDGLLSPDAAMRAVALEALRDQDREQALTLIRGRIERSPTLPVKPLAEVLWSVAGTAARVSLQAWQAKDVMRSRRQRTQEIIDSLPTVAAVPARAGLAWTAPDLPPYPAADMEAVVPEHLRRWLENTLDLEALNAAIGDEMARLKAADPRHGHALRVLQLRDFDRLFPVLEGKSSLGHLGRGVVLAATVLPGAVRRMLGHPDMPLMCFLRAPGDHHDALSFMADHRGYREDPERPFALSHHLDLRTLADAAGRLDWPRPLLQTAAFILATPAGTRPVVPDALIWPFFFEHPELLEDALTLRPPDLRRAVCDRALMVLEMMPEAPVSLVPLLLSLARYGHPDDRARARALMLRQGVRGLSQDSAATRAVAAGWLADIAAAEAVPALRAAFDGEPAETVRAAIVAALEACGHVWDGAKPVSDRAVPLASVPRPLVADIHTLLQDIANQGVALDPAPPEPGVSGEAPPPEHIERFRHFLAVHLGEADPDFVDAAGRYVETGETRTLVLTGRPHKPFYWRMEALRGFLGDTAIADPGFYLRLARLLSAFVLWRTLDEEKDADWLRTALETADPPRILVKLLALCPPANQPDATVLLEVWRLAGKETEEFLEWMRGMPRLCALPRADALILQHWPAFEGALACLARSGLATGARKDAFLPLLLSPRASIRTPARAVLRWCDQAVVQDFLVHRIQDGDSAEAIGAAELLLEIAGAAALPHIEATEGDAQGRECLTELLEAARLVAVAEAQPPVTLPPAPPADMEAVVPDHLRRWPFDHLADINAEIIQDVGKPLKRGDPLSADDLHWLLTVMDGRLGVNRLETNRRGAQFGSRSANTIAWCCGKSFLLRSFIGHPDMPLACFLRAAEIDQPEWALSLERGEPGHWEDPNRPFALSHRLDLRTLADTLEKQGAETSCDRLMLAPWYAYRTPPPEAPLLPPELVWPYFIEHPEPLAEAVLRPSDEKMLSRALTVLEAMPAVPPRLIPRLLDIAVAGRAEHRQRAQAVLAPLPGIRAWVEHGLRAADAERRILAATWLTRLAQPAAVPALQVALKAARGDRERLALIEALDACGHDSGALFDLAAQRRDAARLLARGALAPLDWFPLAELPAVRLADGGGPLPPDIVHAWLALACKAKTPGGSAALRQQVRLIDAADRPALARFILTAWLAQVEREDAASNAYATASRQAYDERVRWQLRSPFSPGFLNEKRPEWPNSDDFKINHAAPCRGILGIAAVCGDESLVPLAGPALTAWDGSKRHLIIALLDMLAAIDHPAAIHAVLAFATRHPARTVRRSATALVQGIADARGWTVEDLADRTVPTGGLDDDGTLSVSFGPRRFVLFLTDELSLLLRDETGKVIRHLPEPRAGDDPDQAAAAKRTVAAVRKELKALLPVQTQRLREAMWFGKTWPAEDWRRAIADHPVLGRMAQRLVWRAGDVLFRPLADGSLTDADDRKVTLPAGEAVGLAHESAVGTGAAAAWLRHLADYEVAPLFPQFDRPLPTLTETQTCFTQALGRVMTAQTLNGLMKKLGYRQGPTVDNGWYFTFIKPLPSLALDATVFFSGAGHDNKEQPVAVKEVGLHRPDATYPKPAGCTPLATLPKPLVAELYGEVMILAAAGTFDPDWEANTAP